MASNTGGSWDSHWSQTEEQLSVVGVISRLVRKWLFQPALKKRTNRSFTAQGIFMEAGCGSSQTSACLRREGRYLVGIDFSLGALRQARQAQVMDALVCADILAIPLREGSVDGVWNLGVMEHFTPTQIHCVLKEIRRTLKPGASIVLFWPPSCNPSRWVLAPIEAAVSLVSGRKYRVFPDEVSRLRSRAQGRMYLEEAGFTDIRVAYSARTAWINSVVEGRKPVEV